VAACTQQPGPLRNPHRPGAGSVQPRRGILCSYPLERRRATDILDVSLLSISVRTAESHRASILRKLGLRNQIDLVLHAHRRAPRYSAQSLR
jgi:hypothetical protein